MYHKGTQEILNQKRTATQKKPKCRQPHTLSLLETTEKKTLAIEEKNTMWKQALSPKHLIRYESLFESK